MDLHWSTGDHDNNLSELLIASYNHIKNVLPEIDNVRPTAHGNFERNGELVGKQEFELLRNDYKSRDVQDVNAGMKGSHVAV